MVDQIARGEQQAAISFMCRAWKSVRPLNHASTSIRSNHSRARSNSLRAGLQWCWPRSASCLGRVAVGYGLDIYQTLYWAFMVQYRVRWACARTDLGPHGAMFVSW